jgi:hypothetical protein
MTGPTSPTPPWPVEILPVRWSQSQGRTQMARELRWNLVGALGLGAGALANVDHAPVLAGLAVALGLAGLVAPVVAPVARWPERVVVDEETVTLWRRGRVRGRVRRGADLRAVRYRLGRGNGSSPQHLALSDGQDGFRLTDPRWAPRHLELADVAGFDAPMSGVTLVRREMPEALPVLDRTFVAWGRPELRRRRLAVVGLLVVVLVAVAVVVARHRAGVL